MKTRKVFIVLFIILLIETSGCSNEDIIRADRIVVEKRITETNVYKPINEIDDKSEIQNVKDILDIINWENVMVQMVRFPDYKFYFENFNEESQSDRLTYHLWISPNKDKIELVIESKSKYIQLNKEKSIELFKIIVGKKLTEIK
ncbi:hypothetical protein L21TH_1306 [Caldisalinibacter kiritimatiensis]|uniref:Uncharacterized protein n=1 Tax=Caldisalinibacter kiritimatiensis TaxID=1304284 RepID=R1CEI2_9FIRM|nr:hypothetical protein L21TH_1306 [Caldisalinibacter kiritimatiensis]